MSEEVVAPVAAPAAPEVAAAPVAPVAPAAAPAALSIDAPEVQPGPAVTYDSTGDAGMDLALKFVGGLGLGPDHAAMTAAEAGDFTALEAALKGMGAKAKGYEDYLALAKQWVGAQTTKAAERLAKETAMVNDVVGGAENWGKISAWARDNAEPHEKEQVNAALKAGGIAAKAMALYLNQLYSKASGTEFSPRPAVQAAAAVVPGTAGPVTAREFAEQSHALRVKEGPNFESSPAYRDLVARRQASRAAGR